MRKIFGVLLSVLCICCAAIGLTGCKKDKHIHAFDKQVITDEYKATAATCTESAKYYYSCSCGEKGTETFTSGNALGHSFTNYVSDNNATCTEDGTKTAKCDRCSMTDTVADEGSKLPHTFDKQVANEKYLASAATCTEAAAYYYSCSCGEKGTETFTSGNALGHSFTNYVSDNNATCTEDGTKTAVCDRDGCNEKNTVTDVGSAKGHTYSKEWSQSETEHWHSATCGHNLEKDRAAHTFDENKKCTVCDYITVKPLGLELQSSVFNIDKSNKTGYLKVSNTVTDYDFSDKFTVADGARFDVCTDKECNNKIASKKTDIVAGDNIFYILVTNGNDVASYTVTLRRRPLYTVSFNANGGTAINSQTVEEDAIIPEPVTTRAGYTLSDWTYDFTQPIIKDTYITANWSANNDTAYKVEYYLENIEDSNYSLYETSNLQGTTDTTATAEIKTYDHFTFYKNNSILSGNVSGDGSLVLKVYYTRNTYTLSNADTSYGEITNATTKKYGSNITSVVTEYLGCEFLGWYNGEELLSIEKEYTFTIENNVTAKFKIKDEMSNFNFNYSVDTCNITGLKDKTVSEIIIPDYVTSIGDRAFWGCSGLTSVTIGNGVTSIGSEAFNGCDSLASITLPFIGASKTASDGYNQVFGYIFGYTATSSSSFVSGATYQGHYNGEYYYYYIPTSLKTVILSDKVTSIGYRAFSNCSGLTSVTIPDSVTSIGEYAFGGCSGLSSVTIPDSMTSIGVEAFYGCSSLASVTLPFVGASKTASDGYNQVFGYIFGYTATSSSSFVSGATYQGHYNGEYYYYYIPTSLKTVILSDKVTSIGSGVFDNCSSLTSVTIGSSVTSIGEYAFRNCGGLTSVTIPDSVTSIGNGAFDGCSGLTSVTIPDSVTSIGEYAFGGCNGLTSVTIGNSVTSIDYKTFYGCSGLTSVTIPDSVTSIGVEAFYGCSSLASVTLPFVGASKTASDGYNQVFGYIFGYTATSSSSFVSGATYQGHYNGEYYYYYIPTSLKTVILSDKVTSIGDRAFWGCSGLTSVTIPDSVTSIGNGAFDVCSGLTSVTIPDSVTSVGSSAFRGCSGLTSVTIPGGVTYINWYAFSGCSGLTSVTLPDSVTSIGGYAFENCSGLTSVTIPDSVTSIGYSAFEGCYKLVEVINKSGLNITKGSSGNGYIAYYALNVKKDGTSDIVNKDGYLFYTYDNVNYLVAYVGSNTNLTLPDDYNGQNYELNSYAFYNCSGLTSVTIPDSVTSIGKWAFDSCDNLKYNEYDNGYYLGNSNNPYVALIIAQNTSISSCIINENTKIIHQNAFCDCRSLTSITIPNSVTSIGDSAFYGCSGLTSVTIPDSVTSISDCVFYNCSSLTSVTIPDSVTSIGEWAFYNCSSLTSVTIPDSVTSIGGGAFRGCSGLSSVIWNAENCTSVSSSSYPIFSNCSKLTNVTIGANVKTIPSYVFYNCSSLTSVTIPDSVTSIGGYAFSGCSGLTSVTIPDSVTSIGEDAFSYCSGLTSVTIGGSVTSIGSSAFSGCSGLTSVTIGNSVTSIGQWAFYNCSGLTSVTIPDSVTSIGWSAFYGCSGLTSITIPGGVTYINWYAFSGCSGLESLVVTTGNKKYHSANNCIIETETKKLIVGCKTSIIPSDGSVTSIGNYAINSERDFRKTQQKISNNIENSLQMIA